MNLTATRSRLLAAAAFATCIALVAGACSSGTGQSETAETGPPSTAASAAGSTEQRDIAGTFDIGGRKLYMECTGQGSPTVVLISGGGIAADLWDSPLGEQPTVYPTIAKTTRVCAYDRPGTTRARAEGGFSRSDPVAQPVTPSRSADDLHKLLAAAGETGPFVLAAHSYGGLVARMYAHEFPTEVAGMVLVDSFSPELREAMPEQWPSWIAWNTTPAEILEDYPDYERVDFDKALDEVAANRTIEQMPLVVLTADEPYPAPNRPDLPADIATVTREAQDVSQRQVARLVAGAKHITETHSGHDIMLHNPVLVSEAIIDVVDAVRDGRTSLASGDVNGLVDVGEGRQISVVCRGEGSPTVVLIAGKGNGADDWLQVLDPADPVHDAPGDDLATGAGTLEHSDTAVLPSVAGFTRVCAYDRPDVRDGDHASTPRRQPHTVDQDVADLAALLAALGEPGPVVLVAHSYGGFVATLFARTHPDEVAGLVMVDPGTQFVADVVSPAALANWDAANAMTSDESPEGVQLIDAIEKINAAPALPPVPAVVLSADKPWRVDLLPPEAKSDEMVTFQDWLASLDLLAADLDAEHITVTNSGHAIYLYNPALVVDAIRTVVDDARLAGTAG
jgi:pimeloyl-ACP methyl ester carboxylesterase